MQSEDGTFVLRVPRWGGKEEVPFTSIGNDFGDVVHGVFLEPEKWTGKLVQGVSDIKSFPEVVAAFEKSTMSCLKSSYHAALTIAATGKKARYEEVPKWQDLEIYGVGPLETVKLMFGFCQASGGRYFGDETEMVTARELKRNAAKASGRSGSGDDLHTLEDFFARRFGRS
jgi:hypothetical protein